jgi:hypothetical protein
LSVNDAHHEENIRMKWILFIVSLVSLTAVSASGAFAQDYTVTSAKSRPHSGSRSSSADSAGTATIPSPDWEACSSAGLDVVGAAEACAPVSVVPNVGAACFVAVGTAQIAGNLDSWGRCTGSLIDWSVAAHARQEQELRARQAHAQRYYEALQRYRAWQAWQSMGGFGL